MKTHKELLDQLLGLVRIASSEDRGLTGDNWDEFKKIEQAADRIDSGASLTLKALGDYGEALGKVFWVRTLIGYVGESSVRIELGPDTGPYLVRVVKTANDPILHYCDEYLDSCWDVELLVPVEDYEDIQSCWIHGSSYNVKTGKKDNHGHTEVKPPTEGK